MKIMKSSRIFMQRVITFLVSLMVHIRMFKGVGLGFSLTSGRLAGIQAARNAGYEVEDDTTALTETGKETMQTATERGMDGNLENH